ncbi:phosphatidate cytidylyltransferase [Halomonas binhaiensis]|uniref:phosphatidate cytidylyltransferase n=1 Tax=Halomonas binhaiensis TaxID=2562282 RepID=UPI0030842DAC
MLRQRVITAVCLVPVALAGLFGLDGGYFALFTAMIVLLAGREWANLAGVASGAGRLTVVAVLAVAMALLWFSGQSQAWWVLVIGALGWALNLWWPMGVAVAPGHGGVGTVAYLDRLQCPA